MKPFQTFLLLGLLCLSASCSKNDPELEVEIDFNNIKITKFGDGSRQVDYTIVVTQIGDIFLNKFHFEFTEYGYFKNLDDFSTTLPTAREFIHRTIPLAKGGDYLAKVQLERGNKTIELSKRIIVP